MKKKNAKKLQKKTKRKILKKKNPKRIKTLENGKYYIIVYKPYEFDDKIVYTTILWKENEQTEMPDEFIITEGRNAGEVIKFSNVIEIAGPFDDKYDLATELGLHLI